MLYDCVEQANGLTERACQRKDVPEGNCGKTMDHGILATEQRQQRGGVERCVAVRCGCELVSSGSALPDGEPPGRVFLENSRTEARFRQHLHLPSDARGTTSCTNVIPLAAAIYTSLR